MRGLCNNENLNSGLLSNDKLVISILQKLVSSLWSIELLCYTGPEFGTDYFEYIWNYWLVDFAHWYKKNTECLRDWICVYLEVKGSGGTNLSRMEILVDPFLIVLCSFWDIKKTNSRNPLILHVTYHERAVQNWIVLTTVHLVTHSIKSLCSASPWYWSILRPLKFTIHTYSV